MRRQRGLALVVVLWVSLLLALLAGSYAFGVRTETRIVAGIREKAEARALAEAAIVWMSAGMQQWELEDRPLGLNGESFVWTFAGRPLVLRATEASGRIDINSADEGLWSSVLRHVGVPDEEVVKLVDAILDWSDSGDARRANGAEAPEYEAAGITPGPKDAPFHSVDELGQVLGMTPEILVRLRPLLTVHGGGGLNPTYAPREVLLMLAEGDIELVDELLAGDNADVTQKLPRDEYQAEGAGSIHLDIDVPSGGGARYRFSAVIAPDRMTELVPVIEWRE